LRIPTLVWDWVPKAKYFGLEWARPSTSWDGMPINSTNLIETPRVLVSVHYLHCQHNWGFDGTCVPLASLAVGLLGKSINPTKELSHSPINLEDKALLDTRHSLNSRCTWAQCREDFGTCLDEWYSSASNTGESAEPRSSEEIILQISQCCLQCRPGMCFSKDHRHWSAGHNTSVSHSWNAACNSVVQSMKMKANSNHQTTLRLSYLLLLWRCSEPAVLQCNRMSTSTYQTTLRPSYLLPLWRCIDPAVHQCIQMRTSTNQATLRPSYLLLLWGCRNQIVLQCIRMRTSSYQNNLRPSHLLFL
jgi:hypothetical protein